MCIRDSYSVGKSRYGIRERCSVKKISDWVQRRNEERQAHCGVRKNIPIGKRSKETKTGPGSMQKCKKTKKKKEKEK